MLSKFKSRQDRHLVQTEAVELVIKINAQQEKRIHPTLYRVVRDAADLKSSESRRWLKEVKLNWLLLRLYRRSLKLQKSET